MLVVPRVMDGEVRGFVGAWARVNGCGRGRLLFGPYTGRCWLRPYGCGLGGYGGGVDGVSWVVHYTAGFGG